MSVTEWTWIWKWLRILRNISCTTYFSEMLCNLRHDCCFRHKLLFYLQSFTNRKLWIYYRPNLLSLREKRPYSEFFCPASGMSTPRYFVSLHIQSKCQKIRTRKTLNMAIFTQFMVWLRNAPLKVQKLLCC